MDSLAYKGNACEVIDRLRRLHARQAMDRIFASFSIPSPALEAFAAQYAAGYCPEPNPAERIAFWDRHLAERPRWTTTRFPRHI